MPKLLVADDNSNVQKTVALALADLGIDVVSVNNGEAAVRKLSDFTPDLILADVFMPVRNGYEVCEFVKKDNRFTHVPVVLLVGAFDPLDEREAQRVGADGILKKPFVPPDPLINMVKTLLDRVAAEHLVEVAASKSSEIGASKQSGSLQDSRSRATAVVEAPPPRPAAPAPQLSEAAAEPLSEELHTPAMVDRAAFAEPSHPFAFSKLLETPKDSVAAPAPGTETVDNDQVLTSARDANLGEPLFWKNDEQDAEAEQQPLEAEGSDDDTSVHDFQRWSREDASGPRPESTPLLQPIEPLQLVHDEVASVAAPIVADEKPMQVDQAAQAPLHVESATSEDLAANPLEWMATAPPQEAASSAEAEPASAAPLPELALEPPATAASILDTVQMASHAVESGEQSSTAHVEKPPPQELPGHKPEEASSARTTDQFVAGVVADVVAGVQDSLAAQDSEELRAAASPVPAPTPVPVPVRVVVHSSEHAAAHATEAEVREPSGAELAPPASEPPAAEISMPAASAASPVAPPLEHEAVAAPPAAVPASEAPTAPAQEAQQPADIFSQRATDTVRSIPKREWADLAAALPSVTELTAQMKAGVSPTHVTHAPEATASAPPAESVPAPDSAVPPADVPSEVASLGAAPSPGIQPAIPDPALVEAVVQRVLDKMRPQVVDIITKEFLRPIVQALVHREIEKH